MMIEPTPGMVAAARRAGFRGVSYEVTFALVNGLAASALLIPAVTLAAIGPVDHWLFAVAAFASLPLAAMACLLAVPVGLLPFALACYAIWGAGE